MDTPARRATSINRAITNLHAGAWHHYCLSAIRLCDPTIDSVSNRRREVPHSRCASRAHDESKALGAILPVGGLRGRRVMLSIGSFEPFIRHRPLRAGPVFVMTTHPLAFRVREHGRPVVSP